MPCSSSARRPREREWGRNGEFVKELARRCHGVARHVRDPRREIVGVLVAAPSDLAEPLRSQRPMYTRRRGRHQSLVRADVRCGLPGGCAARAFAGSARARLPSLSLVRPAGVPAFAGRMTDAQPASRHMVRRSSADAEGLAFRGNDIRAELARWRSTRGEPAMRPRRAPRRSRAPFRQPRCLRWPRSSDTARPGKPDRLPDTVLAPQHSSETRSPAAEPRLPPAGALDVCTQHAPIAWM